MKTISAALFFMFFLCFKSYAFDGVSISYQRLFFDDRIEPIPGIVGTFEESGEILTLGFHKFHTEKMNFDIGFCYLNEVEELSIFNEGLTPNPNTYSFRAYGLYLEPSYVFIELNGWKFSGSADLFALLLEENLTGGTTSLGSFQDENSVDLSLGFFLEGSKRITDNVEIGISLGLAKINSIDASSIGFTMKYSFK